jgi:holin-like protein
MTADQKKHNRLAAAQNSAHFSTALPWLLGRSANFSRSRHKSRFHTHLIVTECHPFYFFGSSKEFLSMVVTIALLLGFQLLGITIVTLLGLPVPGAVMGMVLFLFALMIFDGLLQKTLPVVNVLLAHFALLFVPAGVGIMQHGERLAAEWLPICASILISSVLAMAVTILVTRGVMRLMHIKD